MKNLVYKGMSMEDLVKALAADPRDAETTTLWSMGAYWTDERVAQFRSLFNASEEVWYIQVMTKKGEELLIYNGPHP